MTESATIAAIATLWQPAPYALIRLAGASYAELERLKFTRSLPLLRLLIQLRRTVATLRTTAVDALYAAIGTVQGDERSQLVALRRNIFNSRALNRARLARLRAIVPPPIRAAVLRYARRQRQLARVEAAARSSYADELADKRRLLQQSLSAPDFQKALQASSPAAFKGLRHYLQMVPGGQRHRERKLETSLYRYLVSMVATPGQPNRMGTQMLAQYADAAPLEMPRTRRSMHGFSELHLALVNALYDVLRHDRAVRGRLRLLLNPSMYASNGELVLTPAPMPIVRQPADEQQRRSPYTAPLRALLAFWRASSTCWTLDAFVQGYAEYSGLERGSVALLVERLIEAQALLIDLPVPSDHPDRLGALLALLEAWDEPHLRGFARQVAQVRAMVSAFSTASVAERQQLLDQLRAELNILLGAYPLAGRVRSLLNHAVGEQVTLSGMLPCMGQEFFTPWLDDLSALLDCVSAREQGGLCRNMIYDVFLATYGAGASGVDPQQFVSEYLAPALQRVADRGVAGARPQVEALQRRRRRYLEALNAWLEPNHANPAVTLPRDVLLGLAEEFGGTLAAPATIGVRFQLAAANLAAVQRGEYLAVLNGAQAGFGHGFAQYCKALDPAASAVLAAQLRERYAALEAALGPHQEFAEVLAVLDHNAQIHQSLTAAQIVPPHEHSGAPREDQLDAACLELTHDVRRGELVLYRHDPLTGDRGGEVVPLYLGALPPQALPLHQRLYAELGPPSYIAARLRPYELAALARPAADTSASQIVHVPRLTVGRLVVQRELWAVPSAQLPTPEGDDFEQFVAWIAWADAQQLPAEVFVHCCTPCTDASSLNSGPRIKKPILLDCENPFAWRLLQHLMQAPDVQTILFEEMLPDPRQLWLRLDDQPYVAEFHVEVNRGGCDA